MLAIPEVAKAVTELPKAGRATEVTAREVMVACGVDGADGREDCVAQGPIWEAMKVSAQVDSDGEESLREQFGQQWSW